MYELIQAGENTFYMDCPSKVGFVRIAQDEVVLIDSGNSKDTGKKVKKILDAQGWKLKAIYNTHAHGDHIGGNQYLQNQTNCAVYAPGIEKCFTEYPVLEPTYLYGGFAMKELRSRFLMVEESKVEILTEEKLPCGIEMLPLPGHSFNMVGYRTKDNVIFLADSLSSEETLQKYQVGVLYDVKSYLETLESVKEMKADCFIPSHAAAVSDIAPLAQFNIDKTKNNLACVKEILSQPKSFDELLAGIFTKFDLVMTVEQNVLVGSTVRSYLSYLKNEGEISFFFEDNRMMWKTV